ncbi:hypothetical protein C8Q77DRAFT_451234 [Trametes polyzona]|nr:hypothetical protein C8Q77DRAFT_451234 [Trametes polyzona]
MLYNTVKTPSTVPTMTNSPIKPKVLARKSAATPPSPWARREPLPPLPQQYRIPPCHRPHPSWNRLLHPPIRLLPRSPTASRRNFPRRILPLRSIATFPLTRCLHTRNSGSERARDRCRRRVSSR